MTTRTDFTVDFNLDPRRIEIADPSVTLSVQDTVDTLRKEEDSFQGMSYPHLINAGGKETLDVGLLVGITAELQNAQIAFEARLSTVSTGTATSTSATSLIDVSATFIADGVDRAATIHNNVTNVALEAYNVVSETVITLEGPSGFTSGDAYRIHNNIRCTISGGNLVAVDDLAASIDPELSTPFTSVKVALSSNATIVETGISGLTAAESAALTLIEQMLRNKLITDPVTGIMTLYDNVGAVLLTANIFEDAPGLQAYQGSGAERRERLE